MRRKRLTAGISLGQLAAQIFYSKAQLSKVERGLKEPSRELARLCDAALAADGELISLLPAFRPEIPDEIETTERRQADSDRSMADEEVWLMQLDGSNAGWFAPIGRRQAMLAGLTSAAGVGGHFSLPSPTPTGADGAGILAAFRQLFDEYRRLGQVMSPAFLLPSLIAQTHTVREVARSARPGIREDLFRLGSRYAEYIGWLVQENGDEQGALWWTQRAVELARAGGDEDLAAYAMVRRALVTLYRDDGEQTVALAQRAQGPALPPRIRGLAAQREAQGHAILGDHRASMTCLDRARGLLHQASSNDEPTIGTIHLSDPAQMVTGWCLHDLGRPGQATEVLDRELAQVPAHALRTRARYGIRQARAHANAGDIDHACALAADLLGAAATVRSATIAADLRQLAATLNRHSRHQAVRELAPELGTALSLITPA
ncbi:helix-turn-helix transcriptional regulator [Frankia sp. R82]|uniref:helix-turn-helix domain-containing protein n=1 Tax=Frankia sp. R82 TaxID=2950553 RepID=UPI0020444988|nr:helix-turn-helix transcriptional regulator [Frankia sp. R82]